MQFIYQSLFQSPINPDRIHLNALMSSYTTFRVGGPADCLVDITGEEELLFLLSFAKERHIPVTVIGNGSNLLVSDDGIEGLVIRISSYYNGIRRNGYSLDVQSGTSMGALCRFACSHALGNLSPLSGIPGTLGGALVMNAGAYGAEIGNFVKSVRVLHLPSAAFLTLKPDELSFGYRTSCLQSGEFIALGAVLELLPGDPAALQTEMEELAQRRREKQPLEYPSAGSTFKRPQGAFAAKLIDDCGLRGLRVGDAQVSEKHCGFVVNLGHATAAELLALIEEIQQRVYASSQIRLEPEIRILGKGLPKQGGISG